MKRHAACLLLALPVAAAGQEASSLDPRVRVETTAGDFVMELDAVRAPLTVENILRYVRDGFYDGLVFHRVVSNFVVQTGGYDASYAARPTRGPVPNESGNGLSNARGTIGLARGDSPHSGTSQFYVNLVDNPGLNPLPSRWGYAVFGRVVEGMEVIDRIGHVATGAAGPFPTEAPLEAIGIRRAYVLGEAPAAPAADEEEMAQQPVEAAAAAEGGAPAGEPTAQEGGEADEAQPEAAPDSPGEPPPQ